MNTTKTLILMAALTAGISMRAADQPTNTPAQERLSGPASPGATNVDQRVLPPMAPALTPSTNSPASAGQPQLPTAPSTNALSSDAVATNGAVMPPITYKAGEGLRLNFRGVPLEMVLNYLSDAAGFVIVLETDVKGKVDVWSNQPLSKEEAVSLLDSVLAKNGYAAIRNGRTLTIVARDAAKTRDIPVKKGNKPDEIPKNDEIVTQIIPVRYANAVQMTKDLQLLLPTYATMSANESGNALIITDTQASIKRMAQIVEALDTSISSISIVRVFPLQFADAKDLATAVKELFQQPTTQQQGGGRARFFNRMMGGPGGPGGPGGAPEGTGDSEARKAASRVVAVADERINALVVSAPDEYIPIIEQLVKDIDINGTDITELRVFRLQNADPVEMADIFSQLFPDDSRSNTGANQNMGFRFFRGQFGGRQASSNQANTSERMKKKGRVFAVPDQRTSSIIVSAASELMPQIADMVEQLDANPAKKQKVFVYSLQNADAQEVEQVLRDMFQQNNTRNTRNSSSQNSPLSTRSSQNQSTTGSRTGTGTGFGGSRGTGGMGGSGLSY